MATKHRPYVHLLQCYQCQRRLPLPREHDKRRAYATVATAPSPPLDISLTSSLPIQLYPPTKPPSYKPPELRKSQLHRQYTSLLRSTPLILLFQHNNLKANEWASIRRELAISLHKVSSSSQASAQPQPTDSSSIPESTSPLPAADPADAIRMQIIQTGIFAAALRVVEFYHPPAAAPEQQLEPIHSLSQAAYDAISLQTSKPEKGSFRTSHRKLDHALHTLLSGPLALLTFPAVTPAHLAAALSILAPTSGAGSAFPAPRRKDRPGYYEPAVQAGLQKLLLLGARVEGRVLDRDGVRWMGGIEGGVDGLRAQLVGLLAAFGGRIVGALEGVGRSLYVTMEGRRMDLEKPQDDVTMVEQKKDAQ